MLDEGLALKKGAGAANYNVLLLYILIMAGLMLFMAIAGMFRERFMAVLAARVSRDLRDRDLRPPAQTQPQLLLQEADRLARHARHQRHRPHLGFRGLDGRRRRWSPS